MRTPEEYTAEAHRLFEESAFWPASALDYQSQALNYVTMAIKLYELEVAADAFQMRAVLQEDVGKYPMLPTPGPDVVDGLRSFQAAQQNVPKRFGTREGLDPIG